MLNKLHNYGVSAFIINWLVSFLQERQQSRDWREYLKQFSNKLVKSLLEAESTVISVLLWTCTVFKHDVSSKPKDCFIRPSTSQNTVYTTRLYLLQETSPLFIDCDLSTNWHAYSQRLTDSKTRFFLLKQFIVWTTLFLCVTPAFELPYANKLMDWLIISDSSTKQSRAMPALITHDQNAMKRKNLSNGKKIRQK